MERSYVFSSEDGHIESILMGYRTVKVSFQTWDRKKLLLIFREVSRFSSWDPIYGDIGQYRSIQQEEGVVQYDFYDSWEPEKRVLSIQAQGMEVYQAGKGAGINDALFDVGTDYLGGQRFSDFIHPISP